ncbi:MAG: hypothetical protein RLZ98_3308 [Pseudomonadota bacterium]|jgi:hypothetical protein
MRDARNIVSGLFERFVPTERLRGSSGGLILAILLTAAAVVFLLTAWPPEPAR